MKDKPKCFKCGKIPGSYGFPKDYSEKMWACEKHYEEMMKVCSSSCSWFPKKKEPKPEPVQHSCNCWDDD